VGQKQRQRNLNRQNSRVDKTKWSVSAYTVNAFYDFTKNEIIFPAGILQAPFYDVGASKEDNLGGIGFIIAHEITHSFDNNGSKFDESGNAANWWTEEDNAVFGELCEAVVGLYDGIEAAPGIVTNGRLTLSENIADLGAMACISRIAGGTSAHPDYRAMFTNLARCWVDSTYRDYAVLLSQMDVHSSQKVRANRVLQNSAAFQKIYDIQPGDGMYLAPEDMVNIW
jgi:putative endopeptidase